MLILRIGKNHTLLKKLIPPFNIKESFMPNDIIMKGEVRFVLYDKNFVIKKDQTITNRIVDSGLFHIITRLHSTTDIVQYLALGSDGTTPIAGHTTLLTELGGPSNQRVIVDITPNVLEPKINYSATIEAGNYTATIREAGLFNNSVFNLGTMLCRTTFAPITKEAEDTLAVSWTLSFSTV